MPTPKSIQDYLRAFCDELGERIVANFPPLHGVTDPVSPRLDSLLRRPFPAQEIAIMGVARRWERARSAAVIAECGTGKTLISLAAIHVHSDGKPFTAIAMVPPHLTEKWAREALQTIPGLRVFMVDALRGQAGGEAPRGVNEVRLRQGKISRDGLRTSLTEMRLAKGYRNARERWHKTVCPGPSLFIVGRDRAKLGYFWRHAFWVAQSGPHLGCVTNPDTGLPILTDQDQLRKSDFRKVRLSEVIGGALDGNTPNQKARLPLHSPLWQADGNRIRRIAPLDFIGRYMPDWFDYALCDEAHQLAGDTAQGNGLGTLASCANRIAILTGTLLGGYADDLYNILFRLEPARMIEAGHTWGAAGLRSFAEIYGVLEKITTIEPAENACSKARVTQHVKRRPGASPLLFGQHLMDLGAFVSLEDISNVLPEYTEEVIGVSMDEPLRSAYLKLEEDIRAAMREHHGNASVLSTGLNALLLYPDRPFGIGDLIGYSHDPETQTRERFVIAETQDLDQAVIQAKERRLVAEVKAELARGNRCHVYAVYTRKRDVTRRLERILSDDGIRVAVLTSDVPTDRREAWFAKRIQEGVQVTICHPKIIETGIDLLSHNCLIFYQTGYSLHTLRQASRRSWRIGQRRPVRVLFLHYEETMQSACLRLMGKKMLVSLAMEGKFAGEGLQAMEEDDDILTAMARELVTRSHVGESADHVWRLVQAQHQDIRRSAPPGPSAIERNGDIPDSVELLRPMHQGTSDLVFGVRPTEGARRTHRQEVSTAEEQLSLF